MDTITNAEVERQARARALLKYGDGYDQQALHAERQNVRAMLAQIGHPLEPEPPSPRTEAPPVFGDRNDWRNW